MARRSQMAAIAIVAITALLVFVQCHGRLDEFVLCPAKYPVAPGKHGNNYEGHVEIDVLESEYMESVDSTQVEVRIFTVNEDVNFFHTGVLAPSVYIRFYLWGPRFCTGFKMVQGNAFIPLSLDGSTHRFVCNREYWQPGKSAELELRNVGFGPNQEQEMSFAILEGHYTSVDGTERYAIRLHSFEGDPWVYCSDEDALRHR